MAVAFNAEQRVVTGEPRVVADSVGIFRDIAFFAASRNALVYRGGAPEFQLALLDRRGTPKGLIGEPGELGGAALSPTGTRVALWRQSRLSRSTHELWMVDVVRNVSTPFKTDPEADMPAWSVDGTDLFFALGTRGGSINRKSVDGNRPSETLLPMGGRDGAIYGGGTVMSSTPDGRFLLFAERE